LQQAPNLSSKSRVAHAHFSRLNPETTLVPPSRCSAFSGFLRTDPLYAAYLQRVRWRWVPGIV